MLRQVYVHPSNGDRRLAAVARAVSWQVSSRLSAAPREVLVWGGMTLRCHPRSNSASNVIYFTQRFDPAEMTVIEAAVRPGDLVIDAGANIGAYTLFLAHLVGSRGRVLAVEPAPLAAGRLRENVALNGLSQVEVVEAALGRSAGTASMTMTSDVSNTLAPIATSRAKRTVPVRPMDALVQGTPSFVKLDVEGYEHEVLVGAPKVLDARPILQIELTPHLLRRMGTSSTQVRGFLEQKCFRTAYPVLENGGVHFREHGRNLIAVPEEKWDALSLRMQEARRSKQ